MAKLKRPFDPITAEYVERELQKLQAEQEMLRSAKGMGGPTDKMPTTGGSGQFGPAEFRYGGKKRKYDGGGNLVPKSYYAPQDLFQASIPLDAPGENNVQLNGSLPINDLYNNQRFFNDYADDGSYLRILEDRRKESNYIPKENYIPVSTNSGIVNPTNDITSAGQFRNPMYGQKKLPPINSTVVKGTLDVSDVGTKPNSKEKFDWGEAGVLGAQLAGDIVGLGYSLKKPNYAKYQRISPSLVNYNQAATDIANQAALLENSAAGALRNQGQSSGAYLNNRINLASILGQQTGAQLAELRMNEANTNVGIKNEALTRNAEIQRAETETNAREKDARMQALVGHLGGIGSKMAGYNRDKQQMILDEIQFNTLMEQMPHIFKSFDAKKVGNKWILDPK